MRVKIYPNERTCPLCGKILKANRMACIKNTPCISCAGKNKVSAIGWKKKSSKYININPPYIKNCPKCNVEIKYNDKYIFIYSSENRKLCKKCANVGKNPNFGHITYKRTAEIITKQRIAAIKRIEKSKFNGGQMFPSYNSEACEIIDKYGLTNGYNFKHAMNGGEYYIEELGYWVDGYDEKNNIILECYERHHFVSGNLRGKDINRQNEIIEFLKCKFISYNFIKGEFEYVS